jgi:hypothetical protein
MASLTSKLLDAIPGLETVEDKAVDLAFEAARAAAALVVTVHTKIEQQTKALRALEATLGAAALAAETGNGSDADYRKVETSISGARSALARTEAALLASQVRASEAEQALRIARGANDVRLVSRLTRAQLKAATAHADACATYVSTFQTLLEKSLKLANAWPVPPVPQGSNLSPAELSSITALELSRLTPRHALDKTTAIPGAAARSPLRDEFTIESLIAKIETSNAFLVKTIGEH